MAFDMLLEATGLPPEHMEKTTPPKEEENTIVKTSKK